MNTADRHAWEYNEKNDVQKLKKPVKSNPDLEQSQWNRIKHTGPNVSLANRAAWAQPLADSHCCAWLLHILLLSNRSCLAIGQRNPGPCP